MKHCVPGRVAGAAVMAAVVAWAGPSCGQTGTPPAGAAPTMSPAATAPATAPAPSAALAELIAQLGHADFAVREAAQGKLLELGGPARTALRVAAEAPDPEVRQRARAILDRLGWVDVRQDWRWEKTRPAWAMGELAMDVGQGAVVLVCNNGLACAMEAATGQPRWDYNPGRPTAAPAIGADVVIFAVGGGHAHWEAVTLTTGKQRWRLPAKGRPGAALMADGRAFLGDCEKLCAVEPATGKVIWQVDIACAHTVRPVLAGGVLLVAGSERRLYGLDPKDASLKWRYHLDRPLAANLAWHDGVVLARTDQGLTAIDMAAQRVRWEYTGRTIELTEPPRPSQGWNEVDLVGGRLLARPDSGVAAPTVCGDLVCFDDQDKLVALGLADGKERWTFAPPAGGRLVTANARVRALVEEQLGQPLGGQAIRAELALLRPFLTTPVALGDEVLYVHDAGVYALEAPTGKLRWQAPVPAPLNAGPVCVDGVLYVGAGCFPELVKATYVVDQERIEGRAGVLPEASETRVFALPVRPAPAK